MYDLAEIDELLQRSRDTHRDDIDPSTFNSKRSDISASRQELYERIIVMAAEIDRLNKRINSLESNKQNILDMEETIEGLTETINHWRAACLEK